MGTRHEKAYFQGYDLEYDVYIKPAKQFQFYSDSFLKKLKGLYGISESGDDYFQKYKNFLTKDVELSATGGKPSFH